MLYKALFLELLVYHNTPKYKISKQIGSIYIKHSDKVNEVVLSRAFLHEGTITNREKDDFIIESYNAALENILNCEIEPNDDINTFFSNATNEEYIDFVSDNAYYNDDYDMFKQGFPLEFCSAKASVKSVEIFEHKDNANSNFHLVLEDILSPCLKDIEKLIGYILKYDQLEKYLHCLKPFFISILADDELTTYDEQIKELFQERDESITVSEFNTSLKMLDSLLHNIARNKTLDFDNWESANDNEVLVSYSKVIEEFGYSFDSKLKDGSFLAHTIRDESVSRARKKYHDYGKFDQNNAENDEDEENMVQNSEMDKYYSQRYRYFTKFDEDIMLDKESWYSVTPELIAAHIAERSLDLISDNNFWVIDSFCGAGGNSIQFALKEFKVISVDIDINKLKLLKHNAKIYEVSDNIYPVNIDAFEMPNWLRENNLVERCRKCILFLSPPWGGPVYIKNNKFRISDIFNEEYRKLLNIYRNDFHVHNIIMYLPRNIDLAELIEFMEEMGIEEFEVEQQYLANKLKAICVYTGGLIQRHIHDLS